MFNFNEQQLAQIRARELVQEGADARADRQVQMMRSHKAARKFTLALVAAAPVLVLIVWMVIAG